MLFGYARCSSTDQNLDLQIAELNKHACERIVQEKASGKDMDNRPELRTLLNFMRSGDVLYVTKIDRLARSVIDLCDIAKTLDAKGCRLVITQQQMDTGSSYGRFMLHVLGAVAQFENSLRRERQMAGIEAAKSKGVYARPRRKKFDPDEIRRMHNLNMRPVDIARKLGCSKHTVYQALDLNAWGKDKGKPSAGAVDVGDALTGELPIGLGHDSVEGTLGETPGV